MAWEKVHGLSHIALLEADLAKLEQGACGVNINMWTTVASSQHGFVGQADPLLHEGLGAAESVILVPRHSLSLQHPGRLRLHRTPLLQLLLQQELLLGDLCFPVGGVWAAELFLCLPWLSPECNWIPQAPSALSRACTALLMQSAACSRARR